MRIVIALAAVSIATSASAATNLVANGSFESGLAGWTIFGSNGDGYPPVAIYYGAAQPYPNGAFGEAVPADNSASLSPDPVGTRAAYFVSDFSDQGILQSVHLTPGKYQIGFSYYAPANGYANANDALFEGVVADQILAFGLVSSGPATTWLNFSGTTSITAEGDYIVGFLFETDGFPAKDVVVDRVYITPVPEASTWAMLIGGMGLVGLAARRRRNTAVAA